MTCQICDTHFAIWQIHMTILESHATFDVTLLEIRIRMYHDTRLSMAMAFTMAFTAVFKTSTVPLSRAKIKFICIYILPAM